MVVALAHAARAATGRPPTVVVLHSTFAWLPITETWIYGQVAAAGPCVRSVVVAESRVRNDAPTLDRVFVASDDRIRYARDRVLRKTRIRRHLSVLARAHREQRPDVLHSHFAHVGWANAEFARRCMLPHVVSAYGADLTMLPTIEPVWRRRYRELFAGVNVLLCEGPQMAETAVTLGCPPEHVRIHNLGIDLLRIPFRPRQREAGEPLRVLMAGSFREKKGIPYGIEALTLLQKSGIEVELTLVGNVTRNRDEAEWLRIHAALARLGRPPRLLGFMSSSALLEESLRHHVFLSPSVTASDGDAEGGAPVTVIEMAASGMPVVATTHCDIPSVLGEPNRKLLVPERDPQALAGALEALAKSEWCELVSANRALVERNHDLARQSARLEQLYREAVSG
ncbi:MAG: glycosyltransferase [Actinomycetia bacterium]|nr:glycosyltransferase [Actinomycetes bacterium]